MEQQFFGVSLEKLLTSGGQTLYMVALALIIGTVIGIVLALILVLCKKGGLAENLILYNIVSRVFLVYTFLLCDRQCLYQCGAKRTICHSSCNDHADHTRDRRNNDRKYGGTCTTGRLYQSLSGTTDGEQSPGGQSGNPGSC